MLKEKLMTKKEINEILKSKYKLEFVSKRKESECDYGVPRKVYFTDYDGKKFKGIRLADHSPIDCFSKADKIDSVYRGLKIDLGSICPKVRETKTHVEYLHIGQPELFTSSTYYTDYSTSWAIVEYRKVTKETYEIIKKTF